MDILEVEIETADLIDTERFYTDILGFELYGKESDSTSFIAGRSILTFKKSQQQKPPYHIAFNIPNNQLEKAIVWSKSRLELIAIDGKGVIAHFENWNAKAFYFYDNNHNILEFIARFGLDNQSDSVFDNRSVQSISEIGIVADAPLVLAERLVRENQIPYFEKSLRNEQFTALGNEEGLLIIVKTNRNWYPTPQRAKRQNLRIKLSSNDMIKVINIQD